MFFWKENSFQLKLRQEILHFNAQEFIGNSVNEIYLMLYNMKKLKIIFPY